MQIYARDENEELIISLKAHKHRDYYCTQCGDPVRLRSGYHVRPHFYHFKEKKCPLSQKSRTHIEIQYHLQALIPNLALEKSFPSIGRIADCVWEEEKIIFEVQISSISAKELADRTQDYKKEGYEVVWILHEKLYNHYKVSAAEGVLIDRPHYFTNLSQRGAGYIYDQLSWISKGIRKERLKKRSVDLSHLIKNVSVSYRKWSYGFKGDYSEGLSDDDRNTIQNWKDPSTFSYDWKWIFRLCHDYLLRQACRPS